MNQFKNIFKYFNRKLYLKYCPYYSHYDYFENLSDQITSKKIIKLVSETSINKVNTSKDIIFNTVPFNSTSKATILQYGKPRFTIKHDQIKDLSTLFFRKKLVDQKITVMFVYLKDRLIAGSFVFDHSYQSIMTDVKNLILNKYLGSSFKSDINLICDSNRNTIEIINGVQFRLNFTSGDHWIVSELSEQVVSEKDSKADLAYSNFYNLL